MLGLFLIKQAIIFLISILIEISMPSTNSSFVNYILKGSIAYITLNRADKRNALNYQFVAELKQAFERAETDEDIKIIVLKANGEAFCAGADLEYLCSLQTNTYEENLIDSTHLSELYYKIYTLKKIVIAQIEGHAIAGGCGLAAVCDFSFAIPTALFGYTEVKIGFIPAIVSIFLARKINEGRTRELLLTGNLITANAAERIGLINYISNATEIEAAVNKFATTLSEQTSGQAIALTKTLIAETAGLSLKDALQLAAIQNAKARNTNDCKAGIKAFLSKEKIVW